MRCIHCSFEATDEFPFCPNCGKKQAENSFHLQSGNTENLAVSLNPVEDFILRILKDNLFLALCVLVSTATVLAISSGSINIIGILMSVFLWLTYASARKGYADANHLKSVSGTYYASYIIAYIGAILVFVLGLLMAIVFGALASNSEINSIIEEMEFAAGDTLADLIIGILSVSAVWVFVIFVLIGVGMILVLRFAVKPTHSFIQSIYKSLEKGEFLFCSANTAKTWLLISGILSGFSAIGCLFIMNFSGFLSAGATAAASIIGSMLIKKYFLKSNNQN